MVLLVLVATGQGPLPHIGATQPSSWLEVPLGDVRGMENGVEMLLLACVRNLIG